MKTMRRIAAFCVALTFIICVFPFASLKATAESSIPLCTTADDWTALFDRRSASRTWLGADGIYSAAIDGNDAYGSATENTSTFFIFSDTLMGTSDANGNVTWNAGMPSQTSAILTGNAADSDNITFKWGNGNNQEFGGSHLFGEHKWMLDCFVFNNNVYIFGFPQQDWKPKQIDMIKIPIRNGAVNYRNYSETENITQLHRWSSDGNYLYAYGVGIMMNTASAGAPDPDGYIYIYGYRDAVNEWSRKDLIVSRIKATDFPDFSKLRYFDGKNWVTDIEQSAPLLQNVSCEFSVSPITVGPSAGKYIAIYTEGTEGPNVNYSLGDSPVGPFERPVTFYTTPEHGQPGGVYTYNAKAHPHLSSDGRLLVSYNCNLHNGTQTSTIYHPRFLWLNLNEVRPAHPNLALSSNDVTITPSSTNSQNNDHPITHINDGDSSTWWESDDSNGGAVQNISLIFSQSKEVKEIVLLWGGGRPSYDIDNNIPSGYGAVEYYDGASWRKLDNITFNRNENASPCTDTITLSSSMIVLGLRVNFTAYNKSGPYQCYEFEVYAPVTINDEPDEDENANVSFPAAQLSSSQTASGKYNLRLISAVDSLNYANIGFSVTATDSTHIGTHLRLLADNQVFNSVNGVTPQSFEMDSGHVFALTLNNVPDNTNLTVRPFAVKEDGTRVYGKMKIVRIKDGTLIIQ